MSEDKPYHCHCCRMLLQKVDKLKKRIKRLKTEAGYRKGAYRKLKVEDAEWGKWE